MAKKGQLTLFIIIGILLVLAFGIALYVTRQHAIAPLEAAHARITAVPTEVEPLRDFIQTCLYTTAREGLQRIGEHGGYVAPAQRYNPFEPTEGAAVQFAPDSQLIIPYWWHMADKNTCTNNCAFKSERPPLLRQEGGTRSIEGQLDSYLAEHLPDCFGTFAQFAQQGFAVTPTGDLAPKTMVTKKNVVVQLTYPLEAHRGSETFTLKDFVTELPVNLYEMYTLATNITNLEAQHNFLEHETRQLIDAFSSNTESSLPQVSGLEFDFGTGPVWTTLDILDKLQQMLTSYIPLLKVTYTDNYRYVPAPTDKDKQFYEVLYNRGFTVPVLDKQHSDLTATFAYLPWWKPYFDINCNGQVCQPEGIMNTFGFIFGIKRYNFAYDLSYPVLVNIVSKDAFGGEGYSFKFFIEQNLRNNQPLATAGPPLKVFQPEERSSLLCDPDQRTSGNMTITVRTSAGKLVEKAEVLYRCGTETCAVGSTTDGTLVARLPRCIGGVLSASHHNYTSAILPFSVRDDQPRVVELVMGVAYPVDFTVKKWLLTRQSITEASEASYSTNWQLDSSQPVNQAPDELTTIMLERKGSDYEEPVSVVSQVCGTPLNKAPIPCGNPQSDNSKGIRIYPGEYRVTIYSFKYPAQPIIIPVDERCITVGIWPFEEEKCLKLPPNPVEFNTTRPFLSGYAEYGWNVTDSELAHARSIEFTYVNFALDRVPQATRKIEDLTVMGSLFDYAAKYADILKPSIS
jgi:hypothetical protein